MGGDFGGDGIWQSETGAERLPGDGREVVLNEPGVGCGEGARAEETGVGGEWGRVGAFENEMLGLVDERLFAAGVATPEDEDEVGAGGIEVFDAGFGENFPALAAMGAGAVGFDGENVV